MTDREQRGLAIAALARIDREGEFYLVPSVTSPRPTKYKVKIDPQSPTCTCPDFECRGQKCKHIFAVEYTLKREQAPDGSILTTETVTITHQSKTYPQDWPAYNAAQVNEKRHFQRLLADLCKGIPENGTVTRTILRKRNGDAEAERGTTLLFQRRKASFRLLSLFPPPPRPSFRL